MDYDVAVIGAGVIGLACAERLARGGRRVLLVERARTFGTETSSRNSQVVHAGMYYLTGSLKATLCAPGNRSLAAWCERHGVAFARVGKLIVASDLAEEPALERILAQGRENGVEHLELISAARARSLEPGLKATAALWSPDTGIVDTHGLMASLLGAARGARCDVAWRHALVGVTPRAGGYRLVAVGPDGEAASFDSHAVVNSAGLAADDVAALTGLDVDAVGYRLTYVKGSYFRLRRRGLASHLIYPVPPPHLTGLGIHLTIELDGALRLGPDVQAVVGRAIDYTVDERQAQLFFEAATRYLDGLLRDDLYPDQAGVRPKLIPAGGDVADFLLAEESSRGLAGWVNLIGIESPGLTACLEIAERVYQLLA